jgi:hypothetical protein
MLRPHRGQCAWVQQSSCWPQRHVVESAQRGSRAGRGALPSLIAVATTVLTSPSVTTEEPQQSRDFSPEAEHSANTLPNLR